MGGGRKRKATAATENAKVARGKAVTAQPDAAKTPEDDDKGTAGAAEPPTVEEEERRPSPVAMDTNREEKEPDRMETSDTREPAREDVRVEDGKASGTEGEATTSQDKSEKTVTRVLVCGDGEVTHQLGHGIEGSMKDSKPRCIAFFEEQQVRDIAAGGCHTIVLLENGEVYTCGTQDERQMALGRPDVAPGSDDEAEFGKVHFPEDLAAESGRVTSVAAGLAYCAALTDKGWVWLWGAFLDSDSKGTIVDKTGKAKGEVRQLSSSPIALVQGDLRSATSGATKGQQSEAPRTLSGGENHIVLLSDKNNVWTAGVGEGGCLARRNALRGGRNAEVGQVSGRIQLEKVWSTGCGGVGVVKVKGKAEGKPGVVAWGLNNHGQFGIKSKGERKMEIWAPTISQVWTKLQKDWEMFAGHKHLLGLTSEGKVYGCGLAQNGLLGRQDKDEVEEPVEIEVPSEGRIVGVAAGEGTSFCWDDEGKVFAWGANNVGELGLGLEDGDLTEEPKEVMSKHIVNPAKGVDYAIRKVSANSQHTLFMGEERE